jgi:hypothetical protein
MHDMAYVQRINRIRRLYLQVAPEFHSILVSQIDDDPVRSPAFCGAALPGGEVR